MDHAILQDIGLSPNEAKVYETLLILGEATVTDIAQKANIHRRSVYDTLNRLIDKGLVFQIFQQKDNIYKPVEPEKLMDFLHEKQDKLKAILPSLRQQFESTPSEEAAYIYKGIEGYKNYLSDLIRIGQTTYFLGAKALWFTPGIPERYLKNYASAMKRQNIEYYTIFDPRVPQALPDAIPKVGGNYRVLPPQYSTPGVCDICGDYVFTFTSVDIGNFGEDGTIFVMKNKELADSYRTWFQFIWDQCPMPK